jgi:tetratricopeptide (TPR) repeat protein
MEGVPSKNRAAAAALLVAALFAAYSPALRGGFLWDDDFYVSANPTLRGAAGLVRIWTDPGANPQYYPLTFTTLWIDHAIWGLDPLGYHVGNVLLHALSAVLLFLLLSRLSVPGAWLAAAVWALHPLQVESVAWITERKNTLSGVLALGAALALLRFEGIGRKSPGSNRWALLAAVLFGGALLSKSVTASVPAVIAVLLVWKLGRVPRRSIPWLSAMLAAGAAYGIVTAWLEVHQVGAQGEEWGIGPAGRLVLSGQIFCFYLGKLVWPYPLSFSYGRWPVDPASWIHWVPVAAAAVLAVAAWTLRRRVGGGPLVALLAYGITLFPALGFLNVYPMRYAWVADHFQYLAGIAPIALLAALANRIPRPAALALLAVLGIRSWSEAHEYRDLETLWRSTIETAPRAWIAPYNLGKMLSNRGETEAALPLFRRTLEIKPDHADAHNEIGNILLQRGEVVAALAEYETARRLDPAWPITWFNLGSAREGAGDLRGAEEAFREAIRHAPVVARRYKGGVSPMPWRAHVRLGRILAGSGRPGEAAEQFRLAGEANPTSAEPMVALGNLLADGGRLDEAERAYREAIAREPREALGHYNLGLLLEQRGDPGGAIASYRQAVAASASFAPAWNNLAVALYRTGDVRGAREAAIRAARLGQAPHPDFAKALGLGSVY